MVYFNVWNSGIKCLCVWLYNFKEKVICIHFITDPDVKALHSIVRTAQTLNSHYCPDNSCILCPYLRASQSERWLVCPQNRLHQMSFLQTCGLQCKSCSYHCLVGLWTCYLLPNFTRINKKLHQIKRGFTQCTVTTLTVTSTVHIVKQTSPLSWPFVITTTVTLMKEMRSDTIEATKVLRASLYNLDFFQLALDVNPTFISGDINNHVK